MKFPNWIRTKYLFLVETPDAGEKYYSGLPKDSEYDIVRKFLRKFINKRAGLVLKIEISKTRAYVMDFDRLLPFFIGRVDAKTAFRDYLGTFVPLEKYEQGQYKMPEFMIDQKISIRNAEVITRGNIARFFEYMDRCEEYPFEFEKPV